MTRSKQRSKYLSFHLIIAKFEFGNPSSSLPLYRNLHHSLALGTMVSVTKLINLTSLYTANITLHLKNLLYHLPNRKIQQETRVQSFITTDHGCSFITLTPIWAKHRCRGANQWPKIKYFCFVLPWIESKVTFLLLTFVRSMFGFRSIALLHFNTNGLLSQKKWRPRKYITFF